MTVVISLSIRTTAIYANGFLPKNSNTVNERGSYGFQAIDRGRNSIEDIVYTRTAFVIRVNNLAYSAADPGNGAQISSIQSDPKNITVGNTFHVNADIFNNSSNTLRFISGPCDSALSVTFDRNVLVKHGFGCLLPSRFVELKPGERTTITSPAVGTTYVALEGGSTNAVVTFQYQLKNIGYRQDTIMKSFHFDIAL